MPIGASANGVANRDAVTTTDGKGATWANTVDETMANAAAGSGRVNMKKNMNGTPAPTASEASEASEASQRSVIVAHRDQTC
jgi:hypothetical protein